MTRDGSDPGAPPKTDTPSARRRPPAGRADRRSRGSAATSPLPRGQRRSARSGPGRPSARDPTRGRLPSSRPLRRHRSRGRRRDCRTTASRPSPLRIARPVSSAARPGRGPNRRGPFRARPRPSRDGSPRTARCRASPPRRRPRFRGPARGNRCERRTLHQFGRSSVPAPRRPTSRPAWPPSRQCCRQMSNGPSRP